MLPGADASNDGGMTPDRNMGQRVTRVEFSRAASNLTSSMLPIVPNVSLGLGTHCLPGRQTSLFVFLESGTATTDAQFGPTGPEGGRDHRWSKCTTGQRGQGDVCCREASEKTSGTVQPPLESGLDATSTEHCRSFTVETGAQGVCRRWGRDTEPLVTAHCAVLSPPQRPGRGGTRGPGSSVQFGRGVSGQ